MPQNKRNHLAISRTVISLSILAATSAMADASIPAVPLAEAKSLVAAGKPGAAYELLSPDAKAHWSDSDYLYTLAVAAIDLKKSKEAVPLLERVVTLDPSNSGAQFDLGRAYWDCGDYDKAHTIFSQVAAKNPPALVKMMLVKYEASYKERVTVLAPKFSGHIEAGIGYDDNINNGPNTASITIPLFGNAPLALSQASRQKGSSYAAVNIGVEGMKPISQNVALFISANANARDTFQDTSFSNISPDLRGGVIYADGGNFYRGSVFTSQYYRDGRHQVGTYGVGADWYHVLDDKNTVGVFGQLADYRFTDHANSPDMSHEDFTQVLVGTSLQHKFSDRVSVSGALLASHEYADDRIDGDKNNLGGRVTVQGKVNDRVTLSGGVGYTEGHYQTENTIFVKKRVDRQYDFNVGASYKINEKLSLRAEFTHIKTDSNISINTNDRNDGAVFLRVDF